jgi:fructose 1,6-bisphosphatase
MLTTWYYALASVIVVSAISLIRPRDMFDDPGFDDARHLCNIIADRHSRWEKRHEIQSRDGAA